MYMALLKNNVLMLLDVNDDVAGFILDGCVCSDPNPFNFVFRIDGNQIGHENMPLTFGGVSRASGRSNSVLKIKESRRDNKPECQHTRIVLS